MLYVCGSRAYNAAESICLHVDSIADTPIKNVPLGIGDKMEDFKLYDYNDSVHYLSELQGKYIVLEFSSLTCGPCQAIKPMLEKFYSKYKERVKMVTISEDPVYLWKDKPMGEVSWHEWNDHDYTLNIRRKYGIKQIPTFVIIDPSGTIINICSDTKSLFKTIETYLQNEGNMEKGVSSSSHVVPM